MELVISLNKKMLHLAVKHLNLAEKEENINWNIVSQEKAELYLYQKSNDIETKVWGTMTGTARNYLPD